MGLATWHQGHRTARTRTGRGSGDVWLLRQSRSGEKTIDRILAGLNPFGEDGDTHSTATIRRDRTIDDHEHPDQVTSV